MKVRLAKTAGFCMGVRRAVEMTLEESNRMVEEGQIVTFGPLIHNAEVLALLADKGIGAVNETEHLDGHETVIIRAHGIPPQVKEEIEAKALRVVDATCPRVVKVQVLIKRYTGLGCRAIILGDVDHAEVIGLLGCADGAGVVVDSVEQVAELEDYEKVILVAQTTQSEQTFAEIAAAVKERWPEAQIFNTICGATHERQAEVVQLAEQNEAVVVVGGSFSANTQRLVKIAGESGTRALAVETAADLDRDGLAAANTVGVTAGASTPNWLIRKVVEELRMLRGRDEARLGSALFKLFRFLLKANIMVALAASGLALVAGLSLGAELSLSLLGVPALYLYAMHILNHFLDRHAAAYNDPDRAAFFERHQIFLVSSAVVAALAGIAQSARLGFLSFILFAVISVIGLAYPVRLVPARWEHLISYVKLKDFPGSKPLSIGLAWGVVCGIWVGITFGPGFHPEILIISLLIAGLAFVRAAFFDVLDIQGDLVVGKETLAINLGEKKSYRLLMGLSLGVLLIGLTSVAVGMVGPQVLALCLAQALLAGVIRACRTQRLMPGIFLEGLVEASLIVPAGLAWLASIIIN